MAINDSYNFEDYSDEGAYYGAGISYSDTIETWRKKFNGMVNRLDSIIRDNNIPIYGNPSGEIYFEGHLDVSGSIGGTIDAENTSISGYKVEKTDSIADKAILLFTGGNVTETTFETSEFRLAPRKALPSCYGPFSDQSSTTLTDYSSTSGRAMVQEIYIRLEEPASVVIFADGSFHSHDAFVGLTVSPSYRRPVRNGDTTISNPNRVELLHSTSCKFVDNGVYGWDHATLVGRISLPAGVHEISFRVFNPPEDVSNFNLYDEDGNKNDLTQLGTIYRGDNEYVAQYTRSDLPVKFTIWSPKPVTQVARP